MHIRYRSYFWPAVLILAGVIALLVNTGAISADRLILLVNLWPVVLIVIGLEVIVRRAFHGATADAAAAAVVVVAIVGALTYVAVNPSPLAMNTEDVNAPLGELKQASLEVNAGSATITVTASDLGDLYHAHISYPGAKPDVSLDRSTGALTISQRSNAPFGLQTGRFDLNIELNNDIPWTITENTGASRDTINGIKVSRIEINTGASQEDVTLGPPTGMVRVDINGGAVTAHIHRVAGAEASVTVSGGAVSLNADGHSFHGIGDLHYESSGFSGASDGYRIEVNCGACTVTLDAIGLD